MASDGDEALRVAVMAYTPEEAPSTGHTQMTDMMRYLVESGIVAESAYMTLNHEDFEGVVEQIDELKPELPDDFYECPDEEVTDDE